jgi:hypothetical protein
MHHLDEMAGSVGPAVEIASLSRALLLASRRTWSCSNAWRERDEDGVEVLDDFLFPPYHQAVTAFPSRYSTAGTHINVMYAFGMKLRATLYIVVIIGIAPVDHDISGIDEGYQLRKKYVNHCCRDHQPYHPWLG